MTITRIPANDRLERFLAAAGQTTFSFDFPIYDAADLDVRRYRAGVETLLAYGGDYQVAGAGSDGGGTLTLTVGATLNDLITIRSAQPIARSTDLKNGGDLPAQSLDDEFNRIFIAFQQQAQAQAQTLRLPASDPTDAAELPGPTARANAVLGWDSSGAMVMVPRATLGGGSFQQAGTGAVVRTQQDELAEWITAKQFGAQGNGVADDTAALQAAANYAASVGGYLDIGRGSYKTSATVTIPGGVAGVQMRGTIRFTGSGVPALVVGDGGAVGNQGKVYLGLAVQRVTQSDWSSEADIGIQLRNLDACQVQVVRAEGFTIGLQTYGDGRGFEDTTLILGRLVNNKVALDVRCNLSTSWNNSVRYIGGHFANDSATNPTLDRWGVRFSRAGGGYNLHNAHFFFGPAFELQNQGGAVNAIPFRSEVNSRAVRAYGMRLEGASPVVAQHTAGAQDHVYEVAFSSNGAITGTEGNAYLLTVDYTGATRAGAVVVPLHQAAAAIHSPRLIAGAPSLRATAFRYDSTRTGFEGMALLSSNPSGPPTTLNGLAFAALSSITLNADTITLPTSRAIGFVVDCSLCKDFFLAFEGSFLRPTVMLFDGSENVLGNSAVPLASNQSLAWNAGAQWWQATADADDATYTRLQRITVPATAQKAIIAVGSSDPAMVLKSLRLYVPGQHAPAVLAGGTRAWGTRELFASAAWDPPSVAAGGTTTTNVTVIGAVAGDLVTVGFSQSTTLQMIGCVGAADTVTVRLNNPTGGAVDLGANTLFVQVVKPRT